MSLVQTNQGRNSHANTPDVRLFGMRVPVELLLIKTFGSEVVKAQKRRQELTGPQCPRVLCVGPVVPFSLASPKPASIALM